MSVSLRKQVSKISKKDLISMTVAHLQFLAATQDTITKIVNTARGGFKDDDDDPLEFTLAQLSSLLQQE
jgi:hypothetical protein